MCPRRNARLWCLLLGRSPHLPPDTTVFSEKQIITVYHHLPINCVLCFCWENQEIQALLSVSLSASCSLLLPSLQRAELGFLARLFPQTP